MRGESLAYTFLQSLKSALEEIKTAAAGLTYTSQSIKNLLDQSNKFVKLNTFRSVPEPPISCGEDDCQTEPRCFTDYQPRVPVSAINTNAANANADANINSDASTINKNKNISDIPHPLLAYDAATDIKGGPLASLLLGPAKIKVNLPAHSLNATANSMTALTMEETLFHIRRVSAEPMDAFITSKDRKPHTFSSQNKTGYLDNNYNNNYNNYNNNNNYISNNNEPGWTFEMSFFDKNAVDKSVYKGLGKPHRY